ncbi:MAG: OmpA family protein [Cyclobacteriaceae bacterium]
MKKYCLLLFITFSNIAWAQELQWASELIEFSSQLSPYEYSATQVLGKPNVLPETGDNPNAWLPDRPNQVDFVKVGFEVPMKVQQIAIAESYNPSAVYQIFTYDTLGKEYLVNTFEPRPLEIKGRLLNVYIDETDYLVAAVKVVINGAAVPGYNGIDAIGISNSKIPMDIEVNVKENVKLGIRAEKLGENVNSTYQELRPLISPDGKTLYFSRKNHPRNVGGEDDEEDIWFAEKDSNGEWQAAKNVGRPLNNEGPNFISSITADGNTMVVILGNEYRGKDNMRPGVSISRKTSDGWSEPEALDITNAYIENKDANYFLSNNRQELIMSIERFDTHGGRDLYVSFKQENGKWTEPLNLGNDINTAHNEVSPFLAADDETLYFSSAGYSGFGGSDIYISRRLDNTWTNWTTPENLGSDINSEEDDIFFNIPPSGAHAYFTKGAGEADADIYQIDLPIFYQPSPVVTVSGKVMNAENEEPVPATIEYMLMPEETEVGTTVSDPNTGEYQIILPSGASYQYQVNADGYQAKENSIQLSPENNQIEENITLQPEEEPVVAVVEEDTEETSVEETEEEEETVELPSETISPNILNTTIYFSLNGDDVRERYEDEIKRIAVFMKQNPDATLEVRGYTDDIGSKDYNLRLSQRRANAVYDHLKKLGVNFRRMIVVAYGEANPVATNETDDGRERNRRVTFKLSKQ